jgi:type VI protein secretion system component Hcp
MTDAALIWIGKGGSANQPTEQISLSYEAIKLKY